MEKTIKLFTGSWAGFVGVAILQLSSATTLTVFQQIALTIFAVCLPVEIMIFLTVSFYESLPVFFNPCDSVFICLLLLLIFALLAPVIAIALLLMSLKLWLGIVFILTASIGGFGLHFLVDKIAKLKIEEHKA